MGDDRFFDDILQLDARLGGFDFKMPLFYRDASSVTAIFAARERAARELLPAALRPATLAPGMAAVAVTVFDYRDTDIGPYGELAVSIPVGLGRRPVPLAGVVGQMRSRTLRAWVQQLPVTTEIARVGGVEVYGYPKFLAGIELRANGNRFEATLDHDGERALSLSGCLPDGSRGSQTFRYLTHSQKGGRLLEGQVLLRADSLAEAVRPSGVHIDVSPGTRVGAELSGLLLSHRPLLVQWMPRFRSVLHAPTHVE